MNYIYDITLNFSKNKLYEFYEWCEEDCPEFILKIPAFKIDNDSFLSLKNDNVIVSKEFISKLHDKTEIYCPNAIKLVNYAAIFICEHSVVAVEFDREGNSYMKSNLSLDEENDILEIAKDFKYTILDFKIKEKKKNKFEFFTRNERKIEEYLEKKLYEIYENKDFSKLKYLFYEVFNEKIDDENKMYHKLINIVKNNDNKLVKMNEILSIMEKSKIMNQNS